MVTYFKYFFKYKRTSCLHLLPLDIGNRQESSNKHERQNDIFSYQQHSLNSLFLEEERRYSRRILIEREWRQ